MHRAAGVLPAFPPYVASVLCKLACELPDDAKRSLSLWTCAELARTLQRDGIVDWISPQTVQRILLSQKLKPWRVHYWLSPKVPRDEVFQKRTLILCDLYTRPLLPEERVYCLDEKTSIQPRPRSHETKPAQPGGKSVLVEHEYGRCGALNLLAAFDTRSGEVIGICRRRKRQAEFIHLLEEMDRKVPASVTLLHVVCDNLSVHSGKLVRAWLEKHPRFRMHFTPVHCSWMNQVEQWFSIVQRIPEQGQWLQQVVRGYFNYHGVPGNEKRLRSFRDQVKRLWLRALRRRGQRDRMNWERMGRLETRWLPPVRWYHPWPEERFDARIQGKNRMR